MKTDSETICVLESRVSIREYADLEVEDNALNAVLHAGCRAPTASNLQAYSVVVVRDSSRKQQLAVLAGNQEHIAKAPVFLAFCADLSRVRCACDIHERPAAALSTMDMGLTGVIDASLAGMAMMLAAESLGLGCVMIGGVRNSPIEIAQLLALPKRFSSPSECVSAGQRASPHKSRASRSMASYTGNNMMSRPATRSFFVTMVSWQITTTHRPDLPIAPPGQDVSPRTSPGPGELNSANPCEP